MFKKGIGHFHAIRIEDFTILVGKYHKSGKSDVIMTSLLSQKYVLETKLTVFLESSAYFYEIGRIC